MLAALLFAACGTATPRTDDATVVLLSSAPIEIDPRFVLDAQGLRVSRLLFSGLVSIDPATLDAVPELAERIEIDETGTVVTATLHEGLTFSDGSVLDAADVAATYESVLDPDVGSRFRETYRRITSIETPDARTIVFHLDGPHAPFMTDLEIPIVRAEDRDVHLTLHTAALACSGPFTLTSARERTFRLEPRVQGGRAAPAVGPLSLVVIRDENTRALRLLGGEGDLVLAGVPPLLVPSFEADPTFVVESAPGPGTAYVGFNLTRGPLGDVRVRRALGLAIDRASLARSKFGDRAELADGLVPAGHWASVPDLAAPGFDPDAARALLDEAGLVDPPGDAPRATLTLRTSTDRTRASVARAIAAMWRDVGIETEVRTTETATLLADLDRGAFDVTLMSLPEVIEPHVLHWFFATSRAGAGGPPNRFRYSSAALDAAFERGRVARVREERYAAYAEAQRILAADLPVLPLWHEDVVVVRRADARAHGAPRDGRLTWLAAP